MLNNIPEQEELLREMTERAGKPTPEVYLLQRELEKLRNELQQERAVSNHQKMQADKRLQDEVDVSRLPQQQWCSSVHKHHILETWFGCLCYQF